MTEAKKGFLCLKYAGYQKGMVMEMEKPNFIGLSHVCIFVDDVEEAFAYYERILGAVPNQHIPHWKM